MDKKGIFCLEGLWEDDLRKKPTVGTEGVGFFIEANVSGLKAF